MPVRFRSTVHQAGFGCVPLSVCAHMLLCTLSLVSPSKALDAGPLRYVNVSGDCFDGLCNAMFGPVIVHRLQIHVYYISHYSFDEPFKKNSFICYLSELMWVY